MSTNLGSLFGIPVPGPIGARKKERTFELSLPVLVKGMNALDRRFEENTEMFSLSSQEAAFWLRTKVLIGAKISLDLQIPRTSLLEKPLKLCLSGTVSIVKSDVTLKNKSQLVSLKLDKNFHIQAPSF
jgi:hypothetical protein